MGIQITAKANNLFKLRTMLSCVILGGFLIVTNGYEKDCGQSETKPCEVFFYKDLQNIEKNGLDRNYVLMNDIQAPTDPPDNFTPIGRYVDDAGKEFTGSFDGKRYAIRNLLIDGRNSTQGGQGLFATLAGSSVIRNLVLENPKVVGRGNVGALAAFTDGWARIENVVVKNPTVMGGKAVGGIVGYAGVYTNVRRSRVIGGKVKGIARKGSAGGLVGILDVGSGIDGSSAENVKVRASFHCGGLVGKSGGHSRIGDSFATGNISSCVVAGGLIGKSLSGYLESSYAVCHFKNIQRASGGLVGSKAYQGIRVEESFAVSEFTGRVANSSGCLIGEIMRTTYHLEDNYCFSKGPVGVDVSLKPGEVDMVGSPDYFLDSSNMPMNDWSPWRWKFKANQYPSIDYYILDARGPYKGRLDKPIRLNPTAPEAKYHWTVDHKKCSFLDPRHKKAIMSCTGNSELVANVCLTAIWNTKVSKKRCTTVNFEVPATACSIPSCRNSTFPEEKIKKIVSIRESMMKASSQPVWRAVHELVNAEPLTLAKLQRARSMLDQAPHFNSKKMRERSKLMINGIRDEIDQLEAECCDLFY